MFKEGEYRSASYKGSDSRSVPSVYKLAVIRYRTLYHPGKCLYLPMFKNKTQPSGDFDLVLTEMRDLPFVFPLSDT